MASGVNIALLALLCMLFPALASCRVWMSDDSCHAHRTEVRAAIAEASMMAGRAIERLDRKDIDDIDANHLYWVLFGHSDYEFVRHVFSYLAKLEHSEEEIRISCVGHAGDCGLENVLGLIELPYYTEKADVSYSRMAICDNYLKRLPAANRRPALEMLQTSELSSHILDSIRPLSTLMIHEWAHTYETMLPTRPPYLADVMIKVPAPSSTDIERGDPWILVPAYGFRDCVRLAEAKDRPGVKMNADTYAYVALDQWTWTSGIVYPDDGRPYWHWYNPDIAPHPEVYSPLLWPTLHPPWRRPPSVVSRRGQRFLPPESPSP
ncbi:MAG: hypothetical protein M1826_000250 [Phylliscum demangeonii]|nr:MAG: hypothetical protein M1826_000250 [Phylliscum demangeonii]